MNRRWIARILLLVGTLAALEMGTRLAFLLFKGTSYTAYRVRPASGPFDPNFEAGHPFLPWTMRPNIHRNSYRVQLRDGSWIEGPLNINRYGLRGPDITLAKPRGTYRVLCFGGSTVYGHLPDTWPWPGLLEEELKRAYPDSSIEVLNFGVNWGFSAYSLVNFALRGLDFDPDVIIVYEGINDLSEIAHLTPEGETRGDFAHTLHDLVLPERFLRRVPRFAMHSAIGTAFAFLAARTLYGYEPRDLARNVITTPDRRRWAEDPMVQLPLSMRHLDSLGGLARHYGVVPVFSTFAQAMDNPDYSDRFVRWNQAVRDLCRNRDYYLADPAATMTGRKDYFVSDGIHFSPSGQRAMAACFARFIEEHGVFRSDQTPPLDR